MSKGNCKIYSVEYFFEFNSYEIHQEYFTDINKLGEVLTSEQYSKCQVVIEGYTDSIGSEQYNQLLSEGRAKNVMQYLLRHFPTTLGRLIARGYGKHNPIASNDTAEGRS